MDALMPVLYLSAIEPALDFYLSTLEFEQRWVGRDEQTGQIQMAGLKFGGAAIMLQLRAGGPCAGACDDVEFWFWSNDTGYDLDAYFQRVKAHDDVAIIEEIGVRHWGDRTFKLRDPFGFIWHFGRAIARDEAASEAGSPTSATV